MLIGLSGKAKAGKTTTARILVDLLPQVDLEIKKVEVKPMAGVLRNELSEFLRAVGAEDSVYLVYGGQAEKMMTFLVDTDKAREACPEWDGYREFISSPQFCDGWTAATVRTLLQWWGTEYRRVQDPDYWVKAWEKDVRQYDLNDTAIVVDDIRFPNELQSVRSLGGYVFRINRPMVEPVSNHISEVALDHVTDWAYTIDNSGTLDGLAKSVGAAYGLFEKALALGHSSVDQMIKHEQCLNQNGTTEYQERPKALEG